jgi:hypothetical protein
MNFALSIDNYNQEELKDILNLPNKFTQSDIERNESILRTSILNNHSISQETQKNTLQFLSEVKNRLISTIINSDDPSLKIIDFINNSYKMKPTAIENSNEHMVQIRKELPYLSSFPSEYFPGIINPLKRRTIKQNLNIDSRFRDNYYSSSSSNFNIVLPLIINNVFTMQLSCIELPTFYYVLSNQYGNNYFTVKINNDATTTFYLITIPKGNYTNTSIIEAINTEINAVLNGIISIEFSLSTNSEIAKTIVTSSSSSSFELIFQMDNFGNEDKNIPLALKLGWILGFRNGVYIYQNNQNIVSEGIISVASSKYIYLVVDDFNNNVNNGFYSAFQSSILNKNILARISLQPVSSTVETFAQTKLNIVTTPREYFGPVNIKNLNIQLLDEYGRIMDLTFMDFSFCLTLTLQYDI